MFKFYLLNFVLGFGKHIWMRGTIHRITLVPIRSAVRALGQFSFITCTSEIYR